MQQHYLPLMMASCGKKSRPSGIKIIVPGIVVSKAGVVK